MGVGCSDAPTEADARPPGGGPPDVDRVEVALTPAAPTAAGTYTIPYDPSVARFVGADAGRGTLADTVTRSDARTGGAQVVVAFARRGGEARETSAAYLRWTRVGDAALPTRFAATGTLWDAELVARDVTLDAAVTPTARVSAAPPPLAPLAAAPTPMPVDPSFAAYPLGAAAGEGGPEAGYAVGAPDVITIGRIASGAIASPSDFQRYHADLDGNGAVTDYDVWLGLRKWVDDRLPPSLVAAPRRVTAVPGASATVVLGNAGNGTLPAPNVATSAGVSVTDVTPAGSVGHVLDVAVGEEVDLGVVTIDAGAAGERQVVVGADPAAVDVTIVSSVAHAWVGQTAVLAAQVTVQGDATRDVVWSSDDDGVARVGDDGRLTAVAAGTTTIRASSVATPVATDAFALRVSGRASIGLGTTATHVTYEGRTYTVGAAPQQGRDRTAYEPAFHRVGGAPPPFTTLTTAGDAFSDAFAGVGDDGSLWTWGVEPRPSLGGDSTAERTPVASALLAQGAASGATTFPASARYPTQVTAFEGPAAPGSGATPALSDVALARTYGAALGGGAIFTWGLGEALDRQAQGVSGDRLGTVGADAQRYAVPVDVAGDGTAPLPSFNDVATGSDHGVAIDGSGALWVWGDDGAGDSPPSDEPVQLSPTSTRTYATVVAAGRGPVDATCIGTGVSVARTTSGDVYAWGTPCNGALLGSATDASAYPRAIGISAVEVAVASTFALARHADGRVSAWGANDLGQLGDGTTTDRDVPVSVDFPEAVSIVDVDVGARRAAAVDAQGRVWWWGRDVANEAPDGTQVASPTPQRVLSPADVTFTTVAVAHDRLLALDDEGRAWARGTLRGAGVPGWPATVPVPTARPPSEPDAVAVAGGFLHGVLADAAGDVWTWGEGAQGRTGDAGAGVPTRVPTLDAPDVVSVAAGRGTALALDASGRGWAWGTGTDGALGTGATSDVAEPTRIAVPAGTSLVDADLSSGAFTTDRFGVAVDRTGALWTWGGDDAGQLGRDAAGGASDATPGRIDHPTGGRFRVASAGGAHGAALDEDGVVWTWGDALAPIGRTSGAPDVPGPVDLPEGVSIVDVAAGGTRSNVDDTRVTLAVDTRGRLWVWGHRDGTLGLDADALGDVDDAVAYLPPTPLGLAPTFTRVFAGPETAAARDDRGRAWLWGAGADGATADATLDDTPTPTRLAEPPSGP